MMMMESTSAATVDLEATDMAGKQCKTKWVHCSGVSPSTIPRSCGHNVRHLYACHDENGDYLCARCREPCAYVWVCRSCCNRNGKRRRPFEEDDADEQQQAP